MVAGVAGAVVARWGGGGRGLSRRKWGKGKEARGLIRCQWPSLWTTAFV